jgi:head-tail adaptor
MALNEISPGIPAGLMRTRVTIQRPVKTGGVQKWQPWKTVWAFVDPTGGVEMARQLEPPYTNAYEVQMRYIAGVRVRDRLTFTTADGLQTLEIQSTNDVNLRHIQLELLCKQATN